MATLIYKCPNCGAVLEYNAESAKMTCDHCRSTFSVEEAQRAAEVQSEPEDQGAQTAADIQFEKDVVSYTCSSCGAQILTDANTSATFCTFCGAPTILPSQLSGVYRPALVIPFKVSKKEAQETFLKWCKNGRYTPKDFASPQELEKLTGIYVPFWLFDCGVESNMTAQASRVNSYVAGNYMVRRTRNYVIRRRARMQFDKVPADGSARMDDPTMDLLEPYDYTELKAFEMPYLAGFQAEKYDVEPKKVFSRIRERIDEYAKSKIRESVIGYTSVSNTGLHTNYYNTNATYALLPVWIHRYRYKDKVYQFSMNGQTGKVVGEPPVDKGRVWRQFFALAAGIIGALFLGGMLLL